MKLNKCTVKFTRVFMLFAIFALFVANCVLLSACSEQHEEQTKYDVAIRVACSDGEIYEFPVGTDEKHDEIAYDGIKRTYKVVQYRLKGYADTWLDIISPTDGKFTLKIYQITEEGYQLADNTFHIGNYCIDIITSTILSEANYNHWQLKIDII